MAEMTGVVTGKQIERLDELSQKLNGAIGRLVMLRNHPRGREAHDIVIEVGNGLDDLINELLEKNQRRRTG